MANDFSSDSRCVALWRFENNLLDSIGNNDLTDVNTVAFDAVNFREGSYSADFERGNSECGHIADASLDAGFPFKSGTSNQNMSIGFWFKQESTGGLWDVLTIFSKLSGSAGFGILYYYYTDAFLRVYLNSTNLLSYQVVTGRWYWMGVSYDAVNQKIFIMLWDNTAGAYVKQELYRSGIPTVAVNATRVTIGADSTGANCYDGLLDEMVVFNACLTPAELDLIRAGTYSAAAAQLAVSQALAQIEFTKRATGLYVFQSLAQIEYTPVTVTTTTTTTSTTTTSTTTTTTTSTTTSTTTTTTTSTTTTTTTTEPPPAWVRSVTTCEDIEEEVSPWAPDPCESETTCEALPSMDPEPSRSKTTVSPVPIGYGRGTFLIFH